MSKPRSQSREKILQAAQALLCRQGYQGTGMAQILAESGAPRGSIYFLFPGGKEQIAIEAIEASAADFETMITAARQTAKTPEAWIAAMAQELSDRFHASGFREGSPVATVSLDSVPGSEPLTKACRAAYQRWSAALTAGLVEYGAGQQAAEQLSFLMLTQLEGAMLLCRVYQSEEPLRRAERHVVELVRAGVG